MHIVNLVTIIAEHYDLFDIAKIDGSRMKLNDSIWFCDQSEL